MLGINPYRLSQSCIKGRIDSFGAPARHRQFEFWLRRTAIPHARTRHFDALGLPTSMELAELSTMSRSGLNGRPVFTNVLAPLGRKTPCRTVGQVTANGQCVAVTRAQPKPIIGAVIVTYLARARISARSSAQDLHLERDGHKTGDRYPESGMSVSFGCEGTIRPM